MKLKLILVSFLFSINYLLLVPLTGKNLSPTHCINFLHPLISGLAIGFLFSSVRLKINYKKLVLVGFILLIIFGKSIAFEQKVTNDKFFVQGYKEIPELYQSIQRYLLANASFSTEMIQRKS